MTYAVIMAGGVGSRFWPASRVDCPKQFLKVFGDDTLIQSTVKRLESLIPPERVFIVTHERYIDQTREQLPNVPAENILAEPISRNTAPCINFAAVEIAERDPEAIMVVLPADHVITYPDRFVEVLKTAIKRAEEPGSLVTIGIKPTHPATGYGYIQFDSQHEANDHEEVTSACPVKTFAEKPDLSTAERFLDSGDFLWNSGMFIWRADAILQNIERLLPKTFAAFEPVAGSSAADKPALVKKAFEASESISIDYGVMERAAHVYVVPGSFGWNDVGDWKAVYDLSEKDDHGNAIQGDVIVHDSSRNLIHSKDKLFVLVGVHDLVVVETDDATLICNRESAQQVKNVVEYLKSHQLEKYI